LQRRCSLAAAEPDRADYQVDLAVPLAKLAAVTDEPEREHLERALRTLTTLESEGRLAPQDLPKIELIQRMLEELAAATPT